MECCLTVPCSSPTLPSCFLLPWAPLSMAFSLPLNSEHRAKRFLSAWGSSEVESTTFLPFPRELLLLSRELHCPSLSFSFPIYKMGFVVSSSHSRGLDSQLGLL